MNFPEHEDKSDEALVAFIETHAHVPMARALAEYAKRSVARAELRPKVLAIVSQHLEWVEGVARGMPTGFPAIQEMLESGDRATIEALFDAAEGWTEVQQRDVVKTFALANETTLADLRTAYIAKSS